MNLDFEGFKNIPYSLRNQKNTTSEFISMIKKPIRLVIIIMLFIILILKIDLSNSYNYIKMHINRYIFLNRQSLSNFLMYNDYPTH